MYEKAEEDYNLSVFFKNNTHNSSDPDDYMAIDFDIYEDGDKIASVWGSTKKDVDWDCDHAEILWGDDDEKGECLICGALCDWHWEEDVVDEGHDDDGNYTCQTANIRVPHDFYWAKTPSAYIKYILDKYEF